MPVRVSRRSKGEHYLLAHLVGSEKSLRRFLTSYPTEIHGVTATKDGTFTLRVILPESAFDRIRGSGLKYSVELDITRDGAAQVQAMQAGEPLDLTVASLALSTTWSRYLFCSEVADATKKLADDYPAICTLLEHPLLKDTCLNTACHALAISQGAPAGAPALLLLGGMHGLEWGSCEIALNFAEQLLSAAKTNSDIVIGNATFTAAQVATLLATRQILVYPMVNPDGRAYSQSPLGNPGWRKNRNTAQEVPGNPLTVGVDINRNFDFLFDLGSAFKPGAGLMVSDQPANGSYQGPCAFSEIEAQNVQALLDAYPSTSWLIDLHSGARLVMRPWTDDETQSTDPLQNFLSTAGNQERGFPGDDYGEHMVTNDVNEHDRLMGALIAGIAAAQGPPFPPKTGFAFSPSSGTSHDYAYSRHLADPRRYGKILGFAVEWSTTVQPLWSPHMQKIISEVTAGLLEFAISTQHPLP